MTIYESSDYKEYLRNWVESRPAGGRGEYRRMAQVLGVSTTLISQVVNGDKHFSMENANTLCEHLGFNDREADFFLLMVEHARAGSFNYAQRVERRIRFAREEALKLQTRVQNDRQLNPVEMATYYSDWTFTGVTNLVACDSSADIEILAKRLQISRAQAARVLEFLLESGILVRKDAGLDMGAKWTFLSKDSPFVAKHHQNWRLQGFHAMNYRRKDDFFLTGPMSLSKDVADQVLKALPDFVEKITKWVGPSPSEVVRCLNIDFFDYTDSVE